MHPFVLFWLGVLTGAVVVALAFVYQMMQTMDYQNYSLRFQDRGQSQYQLDERNPKFDSEDLELKQQENLKLDEKTEKFGGSPMPLEPSVEGGSPMPLQTR